MLIDGLALGGYRSFGRSVQHIGPFEKVNLLAGPNNSGKSNILKFLTEHYARLLGRSSPRTTELEGFTDLDEHKGAQNADFVFGIGRRLNDEYSETLLSQLDPPAQALLKRVLDAETLHKGTELAWFERSAATPRDDPERSKELVQQWLNEIRFNPEEWRLIFSRLNPRVTGGDVKTWVRSVIDFLDTFRVRAPEIQIVPAIRRVGDKDSKPTDFSGLGIIERLGALQHPSLPDYDRKSDFAQINQFLRDVVGDPKAELEIPDNHEAIHVDMNGRVLPLSSLGTGVHEVIILAAAATVVRDAVLCIEEPELHLHPALQRKLVRYLHEATSNQYFITTHSGHLLDTTGSAVFRVRLEEGETKVEPASDAHGRFAICTDLGCRASDLMQSNCVLWVEGPSDRIYLNHWISAIDDSLEEGVHYSIMFYGGRLLNHLSANDPEVDDFISLRRLNRNLVIVMDSDAQKSRARLNKTKTRIRREFEFGPGFAWVTQGREIENYVNVDVLRAAAEAVRQGLGERVGSGRFEHALPLEVNLEGRTVKPDKIKVAHEVAKRTADLSTLDLEKQIQKTVELIRKCNE